MANILICYYSSVETIYNSLGEVLVDMGHNAYRLNLFGHINFDAWGGNYTLNSTDVINKIKDISFDFAIDFNHSIPIEISKQLTCPICLWDADNPKHWWNKDELKLNLNRYHYLGFKSCDKELYEQEFGEKIDKYLYLPVATNIQAKKLPKKYNITFIGSNFTDINVLVKKNDIFKTIELDFEVFNFLYSEISQNYFFTPEQLYVKYTNKIGESLFNHYFNLVHYHIYPGCQRLSYLSVLSDLGLHVYGNNIWMHMFAIYPEVSHCYNVRNITTIEENQEIYNSSKISINISHPQAKGYFSWRVLDIMASSACLLTEDKKDFRDLFAPHLSKEVLETIIFKDRFDMREKAIALLNDELLRLKCVDECQAAIEKVGRWSERIQTLFNFLSIPLLSSHQKGVDTLLMPLDELLTTETTLRVEKKISKVRLYSKKMLYSFGIFLSFLPIFSLLFNEKRREKFIIKLIYLTK